MADVSSTLALLSATDSSNGPSGSTAVGTGLDDNLRTIQGVFVRGLSHKGSDIASASTTDLGAVEGVFNDITGTATISSFGTVRAGIVKWIKFEGALTLTHNATSLILKYAQNHLTTDGDIFCFTSEGSGNWRELSRNVAGGDKAPGEVFAHAGSTAPAGSLLCYGQAVSRTTYSGLFAVISTTYGIGDNSTTFNLPDLRGRVIAGQDDMGGSSANRLTDQSGGLDGDTLGDTGGEETHVLSTAELPSHNHPLTEVFAAAGASAGVVVNGAGILNSAADTNFIAAAGSGSAHNNVQPTIILNWCIKT